MTQNQRQDDFPSIRLDDVDRITSSSNKDTTEIVRDGEYTNKNSGASPLWIALLLLFTTGVAASSYYLWTLTEQQKEQLAQAEQRIQSLENKLSATGEEIGESTVALQVKVTELNERTNELWKEMDKLWASAWRRNQKELSDLKESLSAFEGMSKKVNEESQSAIKALVDKSNSYEPQLASLADEILSLNVQLEQSNVNASANTDTLKKLEATLNKLEQRNKVLSNNIATLEKEITAIATKAVTANATRG